MAFPNVVWVFSQICLCCFPFLSSIGRRSCSFVSSNKTAALSHFNMLVMPSVQKHFRLFVRSTSFLSYDFSSTGSLQNNFKNNLFYITATLCTGAVMNPSRFRLVPHCNSDLISVFLQVFGLLEGQRELFCSLQHGREDEVGACSKTARGISEQTPLSCGHFQFAGGGVGGCGGRGGAEVRSSFWPFIPCSCSFIVVIFK